MDTGSTLVCTVEIVACVSTTKFRDSHLKGCMQEWSGWVNLPPPTSMMLTMLMHKDLLPGLFWGGAALNLTAFSLGRSITPRTVKKMRRSESARPSAADMTRCILSLLYMHGFLRIDISQPIHPQLVYKEGRMTLVLHADKYGFFTSVGGAADIYYLCDSTIQSRVHRCPAERNLQSVSFKLTTTKKQCLSSRYHS